ncbi:MAG TPA: PilN domain-containing protein, partial [Candidatus Saccharimonadales bacterium]|nr:PilN domain-containing protein [Candidatus Saccharimonadales bacterium]
PSLHQQKPLTSRLFSYLPQITPVNVNIGKLNLNMSGNTMEISGTADTIQSVNTFVDTLKFTYYTVGNNSTSQTPAFSNVVLSQVDRNSNQATYTIDLNFDPALFGAAKNVQLVVPKETTTRSVLDSPDPSSLLFNGQTAKPKSSSSTGGQ